MIWMFAKFFPIIRTYNYASHSYLHARSQTEQRRDVAACSVACCVTVWRNWAEGNRLCSTRSLFALSHNFKRLRTLIQWRVFDVGVFDGGFSQLIIGRKPPGFHGN